MSGFVSFDFYLSCKVSIVVLGSGSSKPKVGSEVTSRGFITIMKRSLLYRKIRSLNFFFTYKNIYWP